MVRAASLGRCSPVTRHFPSHTILLLRCYRCCPAYCTLHTAYCTLHIAHCILHTAYCTQHIAHCTLHIAHYTPHCTLHTLLLTMSCIRCTVHCHTAWCTWALSIEQRCEEEQMATYCICYGEFPLFGVCYTSATLPHTLGSFLCHQLRIICCHTCIVIPCLCHIFPGSVNYSTKHTYCVLIEVYVVLLFYIFLNNFKINIQCETFVESSS